MNQLNLVHMGQVRSFLIFNKVWHLSECGFQNFSTSLVKEVYTFLKHAPFSIFQIAHLGRVIVLFVV